METAVDGFKGKNIFYFLFEEPQQTGCYEGYAATKYTAKCHTEMKLIWYDIEDSLIVSNYKVMESKLSKYSCSADKNFGK